ncbi:MAG: iron-sulfur cluster insertion protein ErpA [Steroidobacteraceae bacterium]
MSVTAPDPILFSDNAAAKVLEMITEEGNPNLQLRIYVSGGGCSGFQYGFAFEESTGADDIIVEKAGVRVLIDPVSLQYLSGAEVDFQDGLDGARFIIKNPNAKSTCGCGSSFSTGDTGESNDYSDGKSCASRPAVNQ